MNRIPTTDDVARVAAMTDLPARNRAVTDGYYRVSRHVRGYMGDEVTWPTLATWASAQAGRTVRREDLLRTLERRLGDSPAMRRLIEGPFRHLGRFVIEGVLGLDPFERSSHAVSRGNIKVYAEIGLAFARWGALLDAGGSQVERQAFLDGLRPGAPPEGQDLLRQAFRAYWAALATPPGKARSEQVLLANLSIGFHEQTRLQPEIEESIDGAVLDGIEIKERLFGVLAPHVPHLLPSVGETVIRARLDPWLAPIVGEIQRLVRAIVTERLMVLELPGEVLRLGQDLTGDFPEALRTIDLPEARALLARADPTPDSLRESSARNWADFSERMHFIADLFRSHQMATRLFERPADLA